MKVSRIDQIIEALNRVSFFDIYNHTVLIQTVYTRKLDMTLLFLPVEEKNVREDWSIQYFFRGAEEKPTIEVKGNVKKSCRFQL